MSVEGFVWKRGSTNTSFQKRSVRDNLASFKFRNYSSFSISHPILLVGTLFWMMVSYPISKPARTKKRKVNLIEFLLLVFFFFFLEGRQELKGTCLCPGVIVLLNATSIAPMVAKGTSEASFTFQIVTKSRTYGTVSSLF